MQKVAHLKLFTIFVMQYASQKKENTMLQSKFIQALPVGTELKNQEIKFAPATELKGQPNSSKETDP